MYRSIFYGFKACRGIKKKYRLDNLAIEVDNVMSLLCNEPKTSWQVSGYSSSKMWRAGEGSVAERVSADPKVVLETDQSGSRNVWWIFLLLKHTTFVSVWEAVFVVHAIACSDLVEMFAWSPCCQPLNQKRSVHRKKKNLSMFPCGWQTIFWLRNTLKNT